MSTLPGTSGTSGPIVARSSPTLSLNSVKRIQQSFVDTYMRPKPWNEYVNGVGISTVGIQDAGAPPNEKQNFCLGVTLIKPLPSGMRLPELFAGVRVYIHVVGIIHAL